MLSVGRIWAGVRVSEAKVALAHINSRDISLEAAQERLLHEGLVTLNPVDTPRYVEQLGYVVLPGDKYIELLNVVRASEDFDVDALFNELEQWRNDTGLNEGHDGKG